jgi:AcrR family transcriptional regulator
MNTQKKPRQRRTNTEIDIEITNTVSELIKEVGFSKLTLKDVMEHGQISAPVFNSRYKSMEDLIDQYVRRYDYWLNNAIDIDPTNIEDPKEYYIQGTEKLIRSFYKNREIQQLFLWEMSEENPITIKTATLRERETVRLVKFFEELFKDSGVDIAATTAILIGGIYDIILRKDRSTFCNVDFSKKVGMQRLIDASRTIITLLYDKKEHQEAMINVAKILINNNVSTDIIVQSTGLSIEQISNIK